MRKLAITAMLLLLAGAIAVAQQSASDQAQGAASQAAGAAQSAGSQAAGAASNAAGAVKSGAEQAGEATKNAVTGNSSDQTNQQQQTSTENPTTAQKKLPQTASPLPLLGLLGLGTFSFGAWKTRLFRR